MIENCTEDKTSLRERICDLARLHVIEDIGDRIHDRMGHGEVLTDLLTGTDDKIDDEIFSLYETYLRRIQRGVKSMPVHL